MKDNTGNGGGYYKKECYCGTGYAAITDRDLA